MILSDFITSALVFILFLSVLPLLFKNEQLVVYLSAACSLVVFWLFLFLAFIFTNYFSTQYLFNLSFKKDIDRSFSVFHECSYFFSELLTPIFINGVDSINLIFLVLTAFVFFLCTLVLIELYYFNLNSLKNFLFLLIVTQVFSMLAFITINFFFFYIFFESVLVPMFLIIVIWGSQKRKVLASYLFFMYTVSFSFLFLYGLLLLGTWVPTMDVFYLKNYLALSFYQEKFIWVCVFLAFAVKVPVFPLHGWLPEAHVEAPTVGSMILASILLKLGGYGIIKFLIPVLPLATTYFKPLVVYFCLLGSFYGACSATMQSDFKKILAYSSVAHMNFSVLGLFSLNLDGFLGAIIGFISHAFVSAGLFYLVGSLYRRFSTRHIHRYGGLFNLLPIMSFFFIFFVISNMAAPPLLSFTSEVLVLLSFFRNLNFYGLLIFFMLLLVYLLTLLYNIRLYSLIFYGEVKEILYNKSFFCKKKVLADFTYVEFLVFSILSFLILFTGLNSGFLIEFILMDLKLVSGLF